MTVLRRSVGVLPGADLWAAARGGRHLDKKGAVRGRTDANRTTILRHGAVIGAHVVFVGCRWAGNARTAEIGGGALGSR